jgi:hypothetical protein
MASGAKAGGRKVRAVLALGALSGALFAFGGTAARAQNEFPGPAVFSGYSNGSNVHVDALNAGATGPRVADVETTFSGSAANSAGLKEVPNEMGVDVVPAPGTKSPSVDPAGKQAYGKGSAVEVGLGNNIPISDTNQIPLPTPAEAAAAPAARSDGKPVTNSSVTGLIDNPLVTVPGDPVAYVKAASTQAAAAYNPRTCPIGQPLSYGRSHTATAQVLDAGKANADGSMGGPVVSAQASAFGDNRSENDARSFTYLVSNGDGTYGVASETHQTFAPIALLGTDPTAPPPVVIEVLGEWVFRAVATGKPGGAKVTYAVIGPSADPDPVVIRIWLGATKFTDLPALEIKRSQLFTPTGINVPAAPLLDLTIGEMQRALQPGVTIPKQAAAAPALQAADGTKAAGAADVVRLTALDAGGGVTLAGLRVGHSEASVSVPAGGIKCTFPVTKTPDKDPVGAGDNFTWTISIPSDAHALDGLACDIVSMSAVDKTSLVTGNPSFTLTGASDGGVITGTAPNYTITFPNLGAYKNGDPPKLVTITGKIANSTAAGQIKDAVDVTANLGNCTGGGVLTGDALASFLGSAKLVGTGGSVQGSNVASILGTGTLSGPTVNGGVLGLKLPATGGPTTELGIFALIAMTLGYAAYRITRKATPVKTKP